MIARIQQLTALAILGAAAAWAWYFSAQGYRSVAAVGALLICFAHAVILGMEFLLLARFGGRDVVDPAPPAELARAWLGEIATASLVFCWRQPFQANGQPDYLPCSTASRRGVVFVHGFLCNRGLWNPLMVQLRSRGIPFIAVNLEPPFASISSYGSIIESAIARLEKSTRCEPVVVGHSMGGLAVRAWLADYRASARIHCAITVACPHGGTWLARFARSSNGRQMRLASSWLRDLASREHEIGHRFVCFFGRCDNVVFPIVSAVLPGADNRHIAATAHVRMAYHPDVIAEVLRSVSSADERFD